MSPQDRGRVSVAILSWNGRRHLETCLTALAAQADPGVDWEILVLDNGSTDGTAAWMRERWGSAARVRLVESPVNLGFCAARANKLLRLDGLKQRLSLLFGREQFCKPAIRGHGADSLGVRMQRQVP